VTRDRLDGGLLPALATLAPRLVATGASRSPRAAPADAVAERLRAAGAGTERVATAATPASALELAGRWAHEVAGAGGPPTAVVAGSLYLVGEARALLLGDRLEPFERWQ
jgi:folylpolyglutamate synthase/dihydropteroate synthase